jgi:putative ABC transport system permease protein
MLRHLTVRLGSLFRRERLEQELDAELRYHIDMLVEQNIARGMSAAAARREALRVFGAVAGVKDDVRDHWLARFVEVAAQDIRYGMRSLRRNPGFALVIIITMALGIGANTAIFSVVNGVLLRPLPYKEGDKLVELHHGKGDTVANPANEYFFSPKDIDDYRKARSFSDVVEFHNLNFTLLGRAEPLRVSTGVVSANYFDVLGVKPLYGRTFVAADDAAGAPAVLVLTYKYWAHNFDEDPGVIGKVFRMNDKPHTVIGILPQVPLYPVDAQGKEMDVYMPSSACPFRSAQALIDNRQGRMLNAFARVIPEATLEKSAADLELTAARLRQDYPKDYPDSDFHAMEVPLKDAMTVTFRPTLWILLGTAGFVLLIVCASIANLLLARMVKRDRELSVRAALGATRSRMIRQLLTESLILAISGGVLGLALAAFAMKLLVIFAERFTPRAHEISIDLTVLAFTFGLSVLTGLLFGSIPGFSRRVDVAPALRDGTRTTQSSQRIRSALIVGQISASFMLLIGAGLMLRSLLNVQEVNPGFRTEHLLTFRGDMSFDKFPLSLPQADRRAKMAGYWAQFEEKLRAIPGVALVGGGGTFPLNEQPPFPNALVREFHPLPPGVQPPQINLRFASADYFRTLGQTLIAGRAFTRSDAFTAPAVAVVNQSAARLYWPNEDPVGSRLVTGKDRFTTIVGVVADVRQQLDQDPAAELYVPLQQFALLATTWMVQTELPVGHIERAIRETALAHDADLPLTNFRTLAEVRSTTLAPRRVVVALIGLFGFLALVITAAGIAGVVAFSVNQRTHEFGIRMALGAQRSRVLSLVIREGLLLVIVGLAIGIAGALALTKVLGAVLVSAAPSNGPLLVNVALTDAGTYLGVAAVLILVALLACLMPARRAATVDPMIALRAQ